MKIHDKRRGKLVYKPKEEGIVTYDSEKRAKTSKSRVKSSDIVEWLHRVNSGSNYSLEGRLRPTTPSVTDFSEIDRKTSTKSLPAVFAIRETDAKNTEKVLDFAYFENSNSFHFVSYLGQNAPPLHLGMIKDMETAGLDKHFISMLLRPEQYAGDDEEEIFSIKVFYSVIAKASPISEQLQPYQRRIEKEYSKSEVKGALDDLLITASSLENTSLVELLLQKGANPNARSWLRGTSAINVATSYQRKDTIRLLIESGADADARETFPMSNTPRDSKDHLEKAPKKKEDP